MASALRSESVTQQSLLLARIDAAVDEINKAQRALDALEVGKRLEERVRGPLGRVFEDTRDKLLALADEVRERGRDRPGSLGPLWTDFTALAAGPKLRQAREETLAFVEGILVRSARVDGGVCSVADSLLEELRRRCHLRWDGFTIPAEGEFFTGLANVIRLRFPETGVWDLPVAAHEFGHLAAGQLTDASDRRPFEELLASREAPIEPPASASYEAYLHEYFADVFATYTVGGCYPAACLLLRFDPSAAHSDGERHPSPARRAHVMLAALTALDKGGTRIRRPFGDLAARLRAGWEAAMAEAGQPPLADEQGMPLDEIADLLVVKLKGALTPEARYGIASVRHAEEMAEGLADEGQVAAPGEALIADVVNAAWLYRIENWDAGPFAMRAASDRALELCRQVAARRRDDGDGG